MAYEERWSDRGDQGPWTYWQLARDGRTLSCESISLWCERGVEHVIKATGSARIIIRGDGNHDAIRNQFPFWLRKVVIAVDLELNALRVWGENPECGYGTIKNALVAQISRFKLKVERK